MSASSLFREHPKRLDIPLFTMLSLVLLAIGLNMPVVETTSALKSDSSYSVLGGIAVFWDSGDYIIGSIVALFSVVFPVAKIAALLWLWFAPTRLEGRKRYLRVIEPLGKWSMLDVLVVILLSGAVKLGIIADAAIRGGAYVFGAAILLSIVAASLMGAIAGPDMRYRELPRKRSWLLPLLALGGGLCLIGGLLLPLMVVEKWIFWEETYSIAEGVIKLWREGDATMAVSFALFVVVLPVLLQSAQIVLSLLQLMGQGSGRGIVWLVEISRWAMTDVFALAILVVVVRLGNWTDIEPKPGLYLFMAAIGFSTVVSLWLRRIYRRRGSRS